MKLVAILAIAITSMAAQTFEVASVRRSTPETSSGARSTGAIPRQQEPGRINYLNVKLKSVIALAYRVPSDQVAGPQWLDDERYDIVATLPAGTPQEQVPDMLQDLLKDRFDMALHEETRPRPGYVLVADKNAPKFRPAKEGESMGFTVGSERIDFTNTTLAGLAAALSTFMGRPVADETGIQGRFDIALNVSMEDVRSGAILGAIRDLGLKLETRSAPARFIVVDKASRVPTGN
jgi:uncharacterized protein (TIGR03435 family)